MKDRDFECVTDLTEAKVDVDARVIRNVVLLSKISRDAKGNVRRRYSDAAMRDSVQVFENAPAFAGHAFDTKTAKDRANDPLQAYGTYMGVHLVNEGTEQCKTVGDLHCFECAAGTHVLSIAKTNPKMAGNSISASGPYRMENGIQLIEGIKSRTILGHRASADLVTDPATTTHMFESKDAPLSETKTKKERHMELVEVKLADLREARPDLATAFKAEGAASRDAEVTALKESKAALETELTETKKQLDAMQVKAALDMKRSKIDAMLTESKLPQESITDVFRATLMGLQESTQGDKKLTVEEQALALIEDRRKLVAEKTGGVKGNTGHTGLKETSLDNKQIAAGLRASRRG